MKAIIGILLFSCSIIALIFLAYREVNFIWYVVLIILTIFGSRLIISSGTKRIIVIEKEIDENLEKLKSTGQLIKLDFDSCEFHDNSYSHQVTDQNIGYLASVSPYNQEILTTENVNQSALTFNYSGGGKIEKFKQAFPFSSEALKFYVLKNNITLYVDRNDRTKYFFDLKI